MFIHKVGNKMIKKTDLVIVVYTCDKKEKLWPYFSFFFHTYFKDCIFHLLFLCETKRPENEDSILTGENLSMSERLKFLLALKEPKYYLILCDDYFITDTNSLLLKNTLEDCIKYEIDYCNCSRENNTKQKMKPCCSLNKLKNIDFYGISLQPSLWQKDFLAFVSTHEINTPWDFEKVFFQNDNLKNHLIDSKLAHSKNNIFNFINANLVGFWNRNAIKRNKKEKLSMPDNIKYLKKKTQFHFFLTSVQCRFFPYFAKKKLEK